MGRNVKYCLAVVLLCMPLVCAAWTGLREGDRVAVLAPSYCAPDSLIDLGIACLRESGLVPVEAPHLRTRFPADFAGETYAGKAAERADDILWALRNPEIKALICLRGGYGAIQTLPFLSRREIRRADKPVVGYSDISVLQVAWTRAGVKSIHGPMLTTLAAKGLDDEDNATMLRMLMGDAPRYEIAPDSLNVCGKASGILVGGNMISFLTLPGPDYDCLKDQDCILYLEEVGESMHAIDRLLNILFVGDRMKHVKGLIFGKMTDCTPDLSYSSVEEMIACYIDKLGIPVCFGFPAGHGERCAPLLFGAPASLDVSPNGAVLAW